MTTEMPKPTPPPLTPMEPAISRFFVQFSDAVIDASPATWIVVRAPTYACVRVVGTMMTIAPPKPGELLETPTAAASAKREFVIVALTVRPPPPCICAPDPIHAFTELPYTFTTTPIPMPAPPVDPPSPPAPSTIVTSALAFTLMLWSMPAVAVSLTWAPSPIEALVSSVKISITTEPPTEALPVLADPPAARAVKSNGMLNHGMVKAVSGTSVMVALTSVFSAASR